MEMLSLIRSSLSTGDNTNPITTHFQLARQTTSTTASCGTELLWKIYDATKLSDRTRVSVLMCDKRDVDKLHKARRRRDVVSELLRRDVLVLGQLHHAHVLRLVHSLLESNSSMAYATEPITSSLANIVSAGGLSRLSATSSADTSRDDCLLLETEVKCGILQVASAVSYLHTTVHVLHMNICPSCVVVTPRGTWKLCGFGFAEQHGTTASTEFPAVTKHHKLVQPDIDYLAPEVQLGTAPFSTSSCDIFSLGMLVCALYNGGKSLLQASHNPAAYAKQVDKMTEQFSELSHQMPAELTDIVEKMINRDVRYRPTAQQFVTMKYFDDAVVHCLKDVDNVDNFDYGQKLEYFNLLVQTMPTVPRKLLFKAVLPMLVEQLQCAANLTLLLPSLLTLVAISSVEEYRSKLRPHVNHVFSTNKPVQVTLLLLRHLEVVLAKATDNDIRAEQLPLALAALESSSIECCEAAFGVFAVLHKYMDDRGIQKVVLPKLKNLFNSTAHVFTKMNVLTCIDQLLDNLDKMIILDEILPFVTDIQCTDVDIIMYIVVIYQHLLSDKKFGLTHNLLATKVMPTLIPYAVSPGLNIEQFNVLMDVLRLMLSQVDRQRRSKMLTEVPDSSALENRSNLQQLHSYSAGGSPSLNSRMMEEPLFLCRSLFSKRSSLSSNSSCGSSYSPSRHSSRRASSDTRCNIFDTPSFSNKYLLSVDECGYNRLRRGSINRYGYRQAPSTPELQTRRSSKDSLTETTCKRYSSFQGLGQEEQAVLDKIVRDRRASLAPRHHHRNPHILVSDVSLGDYSFFMNPRRASTQSMGPVVVPEPGRRDSRGRLLDCLQNDAFRRSSFQGICETAMQFFMGK